MYDVLVEWMVFHFFQVSIILAKGVLLTKIYDIDGFY